MAAREKAQWRVEEPRFQRTIDADRGKYVIQGKLRRTTAILYGAERCCNNETRGSSIFEVTLARMLWKRLGVLRKWRDSS